MKQILILLILKWIIILLSFILKESKNNCKKIKFVKIQRIIIKSKRKKGQNQ